MRIRWAREAIGDLSQARAFIGRDDPSAALGMLRRVRLSVDLLATQPQMGRPGRMPETRELLVSSTPFLVVYRIAGDELRILHVVHERRRWPPANEAARPE